MLLTGPPRLKKVEINIIEGAKDVYVDLRIDSSAQFTSCFVSLTRSSHRSDLIGGINMSLTNSMLFFETITRDHAGVYDLHLTRDCFEGDARETKTQSGQLTLNVLCKSCTFA